MSVIVWLLFILLAPLFSGLILKVKAFFGGRQGPPLLIQYFTLIKLFQKGFVFSRTTTWVFQLAPVMLLVTSAAPLLFIPFAGLKPVFAFEGDVLFIVYVLALGRFMMIISALDTGSSFEGMGASREAFFGVLSELGLMTIFILLYRVTASLSLNVYLFQSHVLKLWHFGGGVLLILIVISLFMILLAECSRVPVDDPATHLELTMVHEVMILDNSGPDLGLIHLAADLKLLFFASFLARLVAPVFVNNAAQNMLFFVLSLLLVYMAVGIMESVTARVNMNKVPKFLLTGFALAFFAALITLEFWR